MHSWAARYSPVAFSRACEDSCVGVRNAKFEKISPPCSHPFPFLPEHHSDASSHPFINVFQIFFHARQFVVIHPAYYESLQCFFPILVAVDLSPTCEFPDLCSRLCFEFCMHSQVESLCTLVETVSEEFYLSCYATTVFSLFTLRNSFSFLSYSNLPRHRVQQRIWGRRKKPGSILDFRTKSLSVSLGASCRRLWLTSKMKPSKKSLPSGCRMYRDIAMIIRQHKKNRASSVTTVLG